MSFWLCFHMDYALTEPLGIADEHHLELASQSMPSDRPIGYVFIWIML